jgi:hypothetical protein
MASEESRRVTPVPERIARLPRDPRGYPIPWNALSTEETVFFTINNTKKTWEALRRALCPICGEQLGRWLWFVGGPRSAFDPGGCYLDLPGHRACMEYALQVCPYLAAPKYLGRVDVIRPEKLPPEGRVLIDETMIPDRPEIFVAVACQKVEALDRSPLPPYLKPVAPFLDFSFWRHGQRIPEHRAMPILRGIFGADWQLPARDHK